MQAERDGMSESGESLIVVRNTPYSTFQNKKMLLVFFTVFFSLDVSRLTVVYKTMIWKVESFLN